MIDISIKMPPAPTPPSKSRIDPATSIPRSRRVDESESESGHGQPQKRKKEQHPPSDQHPSNGALEDEGHPHIDNYA